MNEGKWLGIVKLVDPDTKDIVDVSMYKHTNGGIFGVDASYLLQVAEEDENDETVCFVGDPFNYGEKVKLVEDF